MNAQRSVGPLRGLMGLLVLSLAIGARAGYAQVAPPLTTIHNFGNTASDGGFPQASLIQGKDGNLYGTTMQGGTYEVGTIFKITTSGDFTLLYSFDETPDAYYPYAGLIQGKDGNFYGTTQGGGTIGYGTVFSMTPAGALTILCSFTGSNGCYPQAGLIQGKDGNLYGTTSYDPSVNGGTVFKITTSGTLTTLHTFSGGDDGGSVYAGLIQGKDGNLYGTTQEGGAHSNGTVFKITLSGTLTTLHSFSSLSNSGTNSDGTMPYAGLIQGKDGNLYGTTTMGGAHKNGTVFKITTSGDFTLLHSFSALNSQDENMDGANPSAGLIQGKDGNLYGATTMGGANARGTVFAITTSGTLITLHSFNENEGSEPSASLLQGSDGNLYGTTIEGGASYDGTVFKLTMIPVITSFNPTSGPIGTTVTLKGANFTEATAVKFGTIQVTNFTLNSDTSLTFVVPSPGAALAAIKVTNPFGQGTSKQAFTMTPIITSFSPTKGPVGTAVTLKGVNFTGTTAVNIGSVAAPSFTINSDTSLTFTIPTGAVTGKISVVNAFGTGTSRAAFTVTP